jgi:hypothetical protein
MGAVLSRTGRVDPKSRRLQRAKEAQHHAGSSGNKDPNSHKRSSHGATKEYVERNRGQPPQSPARTTPKAEAPFKEKLSPSTKVVMNDGCGMDKHRLPSPAVAKARVDMIVDGMSDCHLVRDFDVRRHISRSTIETRALFLSPSFLYILRCCEELEQGINDLSFSSSSISPRATSSCVAVYIFSGS